MKQDEVKIGFVYIMKVSKTLTQVRVDRPCPFGGWYGTNLATGREVRVRTARKLRREFFGPARVA